MRVVYTKHASEKVLRPDIRKLKITKKRIKSILLKPEVRSRTKGGELCAISKIDDKHDLRVIYDIIGEDTKVITFHVSAWGRYR